MLAKTVKIKNYSCFQNEFSGFDGYKAINIIIGKNNAGKSHLLDLVRDACLDYSVTNTNRLNANYLCTGQLLEQDLKRHFPLNHSGGDLQVGDHWTHHGAYFVDKQVAWEANFERNASGDPQFLDGFNPAALHYSNNQAIQQARIKRITEILNRFSTSLTGKTFKHLSADRDILPELATPTKELHPNGNGATNLIRRFLTNSSKEYPIEIIQETILKELQLIFGNDARFSEIMIQHHEDIDGELKNKWEIYLKEEKKGTIALSKSGSSLKTVILVLINLYIIPIIENRDKSKYIFAFEELENNLHPSLLRRLLTRLEAFALTHEVQFYLTTHSSVTLDLFSDSPHSQIIHVIHDGVSARTVTIEKNQHKQEIIYDLGVKHSDLLQANGIIWVEGPSDRIYINKWIEIFSNGKYTEGRHYQCAFHGGSLLANLEFQPENPYAREFINLIKINSNIALVCDSDKKTKTSPLKSRVKRIKTEIEAIPYAQIWITSAKEIENYLTGEILSNVFSKPNLPDPTQFEPFFPNGRRNNNSYLEDRLKMTRFDKMEIAKSAVKFMNIDGLKSRFDLKAQMERIVQSIERWNS
jgi:predicted ATP-dependent endonuclease of OLD family